MQPGDAAYHWAGLIKAAVSRDDNNFTQYALICGSHGSCLIPVSHSASFVVGQRSLVRARGACMHHAVARTRTQPALRAAHTCDTPPMDTRPQPGLRSPYQYSSLTWAELRCSDVPLQLQRNEGRRSQVPSPRSFARPAFLLHIPSPRIEPGPVGRPMVEMLFRTCIPLRCRPWRGLGFVATSSPSTPVSATLSLYGQPDRCTSSTESDDPWLVAGGAFTEQGCHHALKLPKPRGLETANMALARL